MIAFFKLVAYIPLYNFFVLILNINWIDAGLAAVILTIIVKIILYPLAKKGSITQITMRQKEGELESIKQKYTDKQEQAVKVMEFYKSNNINPFSSIFTILVQIPVIYSLYFIFFRSGLPNVDTSLLYSFIKAPESVSMHFLGLFDVSQKSVILALLAAASTFLQTHLQTLSPSPIGQISTKALENKEDFSKIMAKQMKYTLPIIVFFISWKISAIVALYWLTSNLAGILQDWYIKKQLTKTPLVYR
jgi:YidC/Oxa1 family membrane protein insertase